MKLVATALCSALWFTLAHAVPTDPACARLARFARNSAMDRDQGLSYKDKEKKVKEDADLSRDRETSLKLVRAVYDFPSMTPERAYKFAFIPCSLAP